MGNSQLLRVSLTPSRLPPCCCTPLHSYCECFASGRYCDNCNCLNCLNNKDNEAVRQSAVESILERNPNAFRPKIQVGGGRRATQAAAAAATDKSAHATAATAPCSDAVPGRVLLYDTQACLCAPVVANTPVAAPATVVSPLTLPPHHCPVLPCPHTPSLTHSQTAEGDTHPHSVRNAPDGTVRHTKGCNCKKSSCLKKYCECFQGGIFCTEMCKCADCKNFDVSSCVCVCRQAG